MPWNLDDAVPETDTEVHHLRSEHVGDEFKILVAHAGVSESTPPAVAIVTDPFVWFGTAVDIVRTLNSDNQLPPLLLVGVGYREMTLRQWLRDRRRDFTPTVDLTEHPDPTTMGGASRFLSFLRDELKPWVTDSYEVDPDDFTLLGGSDGGLFVTYALLSDPTTFPRYGIGSPYFAYDDEFIFKHEEAYAQAHDDLPARVFFSAGAYETPEGAERFREWFRRRYGNADALDDEVVHLDSILDLTDRMVERLRGRGYPSLEIEYEVLESEYHATAPPLNLSRSFRFLFDASR